MRKKRLAGQLLSVLLSASMIISMAPAVSAAEFTDEAVEEIIPEEVPVENADESSGEENFVEIFEESPSDNQEETPGFTEEEIPELLFGDGEADLTAPEEEPVFDSGEVITEEAETVLAGNTQFITVEVYDSNGNGRFLLEPTEVEYVKGAQAYELLQKAGIETKTETSYDPDDTVTAVKEQGENGSWLENGNGLTWSYAKNGENKGWDYFGYYNKSAGTVYRIVYSSTSNGSSVGIGSGAYSSKDTLIKYMAGLSAEKRTGEAYENALAVLLIPDASAEEISAAQAALEEAVKPRIPAEKITLDRSELILNVKESAAVQAVLEPADTTDTVTWSIADTGIATVDENGKVTANLLAGTESKTTTLTAKANDEVKAEIPVTVIQGTEVTLSVEAYESADGTGTGRYILEPTKVSMNQAIYIKDILTAVVGTDKVRTNYDDHDAVTGVADRLSDDGFLDNGDVVSGAHWGFLRDGYVVQNGGMGPEPWPYGFPGQTLRIVFSKRGASYVSGAFGAANKDDLLSVMASMNNRQKKTDEYVSAKAVALNTESTASEVAQAIEALNALPENPVPISSSSELLRIGETVMLTADDYVTWSVDDPSVAAIDEKNESGLNNYCVISGQKEGNTIVRATDKDGHAVGCQIKVVKPVYFEFADGSRQDMDENGSFTLTSIDEGHFVLNEAKKGETAVFDCEDKIPVWNPVNKEWNVSYHWWVDDETGNWQPAASRLDKKVTVSTGNFRTQFTINYVQVEDITDLKAYINGEEVNTTDKPFVIDGTMWTDRNTFDSVPVVVKGTRNGEEITIPVQALSYETSDPNYNFRFLGNELIINRAGTYEMTISLKQQSGRTESAPKVSFTAICNPVSVTGMKVEVDQVCYIDTWQENGEHYVGVRPGSWDAVTGEMRNDGYHITFYPENTTDRDVEWEVLDGEDVAYHTDLHDDGIVPLKAGNVTFRVTNTGNREIYQDVTVTFKYKNPLEKAEATRDIYTVTAESTTDVNIDCTPNNATEQRFNWSYSQDDIVNMKDKIMSDAYDSWTIHKLESLTETGIVTVTGTPWDETEGCSPVSFVVIVGETKEDAKAVESAYRAIYAIGEKITLDSESAINKARKAYDALTDAQKKLLTKEEGILKNAEAKLEECKKSIHYHTAGKWTIVKNATVFETGLKQQKCTGCGAVLASEKIAKLTPTIKLNVGTKIQLEAGQSTTVVKVSGLAAGDSVASWASSNKNVAVVYSNGKITAKAKGTAKITVTLKSKKTASFYVTVTATEVKTTKITGLSSAIKLNKGKTTTLKPVRYPTTSVEKITYTTSNKNVATVNSNGLVRAIGRGSANITVKAGNASFVVKVTVPTTRTTAITGVKSALTLQKGKSYTLKPKLTPTNSDETITYTSSNKNVVSVTSSGVLKALKAGTADITIKSGAVKFVVKVTVPKVKTTSITGVKKTVSINVGKTYALAAKRNPTNSDEGITYTTSDKKVATVNSKGVITGVKKGTAVVTVKSGSKQVSCKVTVK